MENIMITYETLFEILRKEKNREELQKLNETFFSDVLNYVQEKKRDFEQKEQKSLFYDNEKERLLGDLKNIQMILREIYARREKKIVDMALNKSRTGSSIIDTKALLKEEQVMFNDLVEVLNRFRNGIMVNLLSGKLPEVQQHMICEDEGKKTKVYESSETPSLANSSTVTLRFLQPVPKFVGTELEVYGPYEEDEIASLPKEIADVLVAKERAEEIGQN